jgi:hypothetical protein
LILEPERVNRKGRLDTSKLGPIRARQVAVLDMKGSMAGPRLALVKETMMFVISQLQPSDRDQADLGHRGGEGADEGRHAGPEVNTLFTVCFPTPRWDQQLFHFRFLLLHSAFVVHSPFTSLFSDHDQSEPFGSVAPACRFGEDVSEKASNANQFTLVTHFTSSSREGFWPLRCKSLRFHGYEKFPDMPVVRMGLFFCMPGVQKGLSCACLVSEKGSLVHAWRPKRAFLFMPEDQEAVKQGRQSEGNAKRH